MLDRRGRGLEQRTQPQQLRGLAGGHMRQGKTDRLPDLCDGKVPRHVPPLVQRHVAGAAGIGLIQPPVERDRAERSQEGLGAEDLVAERLPLVFDLRLRPIIAFQEGLVRRATGMAQRLDQGGPRLLGQLSGQLLGIPISTKFETSFVQIPGWPVE